jgi:hypothetical protein
MTQQWLTVVGLGLDFTGFMLLLREWWLAFFNEQRQIEMEEQFERVRALRQLRAAQPGQRNPPSRRSNAFRTRPPCARPATSTARPWPPAKGRSCSRRR